MPAPKTRDYFAELYVAGIFGDAGWAVYFPKRDVGFDFIMSKQVGQHMLIRPVQVKGLYPTSEKTNKVVYGYIGELTAVHAEMVLALPFFAATERGVAPEMIAYMPFGEIKRPSSGGYRCQPARFESGHAVPRRESAKYFGESGLFATESPQWAISSVKNDGI
jgi:hypothetical protein